MEIRINEELQALIPPLTTEEYALLEASIIEEGCREAIITWNGTIVDGHNRYEICLKHNLHVPSNEIQFDSIEDVKIWMLKNQLGKRNLNDYDKGVIVLGLKHLFETKAKENQITRKGSQDGSTCPNLDKLEAVDTKKELAKIAGISHGNINKIEHIEDTGTKELKDSIRVGKVSINAGEMIATLPHEEQKEVIVLSDKEIVAKAKEITSKQKEAKMIARREAIKDKVNNIASVKVKQAEGTYDVVVIDPPWAMEKIERDVRPNQTGFDYPTMAEEELNELNIPSADDCHVWLWTTHKFLPMAFRLLEKWGLKYVCTFTWHKPGGFQPFGLPQYNCEFALYARKGTPAFIDTKALPTCFNAPRGAHSEKPEEFYDTIKRVTTGRKIDMFSRRDIEGFDNWGNEASSNKGE